MRKDEIRRKKKKQLSIPALIGLDVLLLAVSLNVFALFHHVLRADYSGDLSKLSAEEAKENFGEEMNGPDAENSTGDFSKKNGDKFTAGEVVVSDNGYKSKNVNIALSTVSKNGVTYYIQDIYIRHIENLKTAFAEDTYGKSITDWTLAMAEDNQAIAAINGDYYGTNSTGVVIRNGYVYRKNVDASEEICVLYKDGTMKVYSAQEFDADEAVAKGAYQAWSFGPGLLSDGKAISSFHSSVSRANPRTAIGYYEPGHYCFVTVDGRGENNSAGMTLTELAKLFESLGCVEAYNLDGGKSSAMVFEGSLVNSPSDGGRKVSDIIYIGE